MEEEFTPAQASVSDSRPHSHLADGVLSSPSSKPPAVSSTVNLKTSEGKSTLRFNNLTNLSVEKVPIYLTLLGMGLKKLGLGKKNEEF